RRTPHPFPTRRSSDLDPPWQLGNPDGPYAPENHYPTLPLEQIKALPVPAAENAVLFLWAVPGLLPEAFEVIAAWGFRYRGEQIRSEAHTAELQSRSHL